MADQRFARYAYDDDLIAATRRDGRPRVRVYRLTDTVVVLGSGSRTEVELNLSACQSDGVPVLRRPGGGCAVVIDPGNVIVSVTVAGLPFGHHRQHFDILTDWLIDGLGSLGFSGIAPAGICDLAIGGRKIAGACLHRCRELLYYSVSLLVDADIGRLPRYLRHPPREPEYRRGRSHAEFVTSLAQAAGSDAYRWRLGAVKAATIAAGLRGVLVPRDLRVRRYSLVADGQDATQAPVLS